MDNDRRLSRPRSSKRSVSLCLSLMSLCKEQCDVRIDSWSMRRSIRRSHSRSEEDTFSGGYEKASPLAFSGGMDTIRAYILHFLIMTDSSDLHNFTPDIFGLSIPVPALDVVIFTIYKSELCIVVIQTTPGVTDDRLLRLPGGVLRSGE